MARRPVVGSDRNQWGSVLNTYMAIEHGAGGFHNLTYGNTASRNASPEDGEIYINTQTGQIDQYQTASWTQIASLIPSGNDMVFFESAAPSGWTINATHNDKALRVVSGSGGGSGGTSSFSTGVPTHQHDNLADHNHTGPSHTHTIATNGATSSTKTLGNIIIKSASKLYESTGGGSSSYSQAADYTAAAGTGATGNDGGHQHTADGSWVPLYVDIIICTKD